jgi:hypothetical protein
MKLLICGSRELFLSVDVEKLIFTELCKLKPEDALLNGGAKGIDSYVLHCVEILAKEGIMIKVEIHKPEYDDAPTPQSAPILRNKEMVDQADRVIAIWNGKTRGTKSVIDYAKEKDKSVKVYNIREGDIE